MKEDPYNPLDKPNLARSIESELAKRDVRPLQSTDGIMGAGIYVIYYVGSFTAYENISRDSANKFTTPIYVGKAIPKGGRKGGLTKNSATGHALAERLRQHATSVNECANLLLSDFRFRFLTVDDIWIPLGENMLIDTCKPVWNRAIDGFGNKDPGKRRKAQYKSPWDVLHPGRKFADKLADGGLTQAFLLQRVGDYFAGHPLAKLPKKIVEEQEEQQRDAEESIDEAEL